MCLRVPRRRRPHRERPMGCSVLNIIAQTPISASPGCSPLTRERCGPNARDVMHPAHDLADDVRSEARRWHDRPRGAASTDAVELMQRRVPDLEGWRRSERIRVLKHGCAASAQVHPHLVGWQERKQYSAVHALLLAESSSCSTMRSRSGVTSLLASWNTCGRKVSAT